MYDSYAMQNSAPSRAQQAVQHEHARELRRLEIYLGITEKEGRLTRRLGEPLSTQPKQHRGHPSPRYRFDVIGHL